VGTVFSGGGVGSSTSTVLEEASAVGELSLVLSKARGEEDNKERGTTPLLLDPQPIARARLVECLEEWRGKSLVRHGV